MLDTTANTGTLKLSGIDKSSDGSVVVTDNAVSEALGLTTAAAGNLTEKGADATTLNLTLDGHQKVSIDLGALGDGQSLSQYCDCHQHRGLDRCFQGLRDGTYDKVADASADNGKITLSGVAVGGNITVDNNTLAKQLGLASGTSNTVASGAATTLNVQLDGKASLAIDLSSLGANAKMSDITKAINDALKADTADYGAAYGSASTANLDGSITLTGVSGGGNVTVTNSALSNTLGLTANSSNKSVSGAAAQTLGINIDGKGTTQVDFSKMVGGTQSLTAIAGAINSQLSAAYGAGYANLASANPDGTISIASKATGSTAGTVTVTNDAAGKLLGLTSGPAANVTKNGKDESLSDIVSFLNTTARKSVGHQHGRQHRLHGCQRQNYHCVADQGRELQRHGSRRRHNRRSGQCTEPDGRRRQNRPGPQHEHRRG